MRVLYYQARNQGGAAPWKCVGHSLNSLKKLSHSQKTLRRHCCPKLVTGLCRLLHLLTYNTDELISLHSVNLSNLGLLAVITWVQCHISYEDREAQASGPPMWKLTFNTVIACLCTMLVAQRSMQYTRGGQHDHRDRPVDRRFYTELTTYLERTFFNQYFRKYMKLKKLHFTIFRTYAFVTDWSIASYQEIF